MRASHVVTAVVLFLSCVLVGVACVQAPEAEGAGSTQGTEPTGEARQDAYENVFHFAVEVKDDGEGPSGGWQSATANLKFSDWRHPLSPYFWTCPIYVGMPVRSALKGRISPELAARLTAAATTETTELLMHRQSWRGQGEMYCRELYARMQKALNSPVHIGATVRRP
jgi:hypothetical protein